MLLIWMGLWWIPCGCGRRSISKFLGAYGYECPDDIQRAIEGMSFSETAVYFKERFDLPLSLDEIKAVWTRMSIDKYRHEVPLKPGVLEFLKYCKENGIHTGIGTSNGSEIVDAVLTSLKVKEYFDAVVTACEVAHGKPEPDIYLEVAKRLGVQPENCLVFEDIPAGIMAGKAAGMPVIAMEDNFSADLMDEKRALADAVISDYSSLVFEYSLFGRPMVFFAFDQDEYADWRGFYYDYDALTPGPVCTSTEEVIRAIEESGESFDSSEVDQFRDRFMGACDGHATDRIIEFALGREILEKSLKG